MGLDGLLRFVLDFWGIKMTFANSSICGNCNEPCSGYMEDSSMLTRGPDGSERRFRWGLDCKCGRRRASETGWPYKKIMEELKSDLSRFGFVQVSDNTIRNDVYTIELFVYRDCSCNPAPHHLSLRNGTDVFSFRLLGDVVQFVSGVMRNRD